MKLGIYLDLRNPPRWRRPWADFYADALARIETMESLGLDSVWLTEHHFFEDGYLAQPLAFAAAIAARTSRLRIGTAIVQAGLHHELELAEQAALVDLISGGKMELGLGAGYRRAEFEAFDQPLGHRYALLEKRAEAIKRLWEGDTMTPPPIQAEAPLWIGAHGPRGARLAGRLGAGLLSFVDAAVEAYEAALEEAGHPRSVARLSSAANMLISEDPERDWERIKPHLAYQWSTYARYGSEGAGVSTHTLAGIASTVDPEMLRSPGPDMSNPNFDVVTPAEAVRRLELWLTGKPVDTVYFWGSIASMPDDLVDAHLELLGTEVRPRLRALS